MFRYAAAQNWAAVPCYTPRAVYEAINRMFVDSLHNEIILNSVYGYSTCNITYKGVFAYNGSNFRDLDYGIDKHNPNPFTAGNYMLDCIPYNGKTLFGGAFNSVGSNTLFAKSVALWNGAVWDTFPKFVFPNDLSGRGGGINSFIKFNGRLWMAGAIDTIGGIITNNVVNFDGTNFFSIPAIPSTFDYVVSKIIAYKNKVIAIGNFYDPPSWSSARVAMFDGTNWSSVGSGVKGNIAFAYDMAIYRDTLYIAGTWPKSSGNVSNHIMKWDGTQLHDAGFGDFYNYGAITSMVVFKDRLYVFGSFNYAADQSAWGVAYYENGSWTVPQDSILNHGPKYAVVYNNTIYMAGGFRKINGDSTIQNFARLVCPDFDAVSGCISGIKKNEWNTLNVKLFPNPVKGKLRLEYENNIDIDKISIANILGQEVFVLKQPQREQEIDISFLSDGIYLLKVQNNKAQKVFKVIKE